MQVTSQTKRETGAGNVRNLEKCRFIILFSLFYITRKCASEQTCVRNVFVKHTRVKLVYVCFLSMREKLMSCVVESRWELESKIMFHRLPLTFNGFIREVHDFFFCT